MYSNSAAAGAILAAFVVTLELESILRSLVPVRTWAWQFMDDALTHCLAPCTLPTAVVAAWGCGKSSRRLAVMMLVSAWLYMIWQVAMQIHSRRVVGMGEAGLLLSHFFWTILALTILRRKYGIAFDCGGDTSEGLTSWQFPLRNVFYWTLAFGVTLALGRYAFPPQNWELELSLVQYSLKPRTQFETILNCALTLPVPLALVFRWKWIAIAALISSSALVIGIPYYAWIENVPMLRIIQSVPILATRFYLTSWPISVFPLLAALRLAGCHIRAPTTATA
jgi:hypothetical protein